MLVGAAHMTHIKGQEKDKDVLVLVQSRSYLVRRGACAVCMCAIGRRRLLAVGSISFLAGMPVASCGGRIIVSIGWIPP